MSVAEDFRIESCDEETVEKMEVDEGDNSNLELDDDPPPMVQASTTQTRHTSLGWTHNVRDRI